MSSQAKLFLVLPMFALISVMEYISIGAIVHLRSLRVVDTEASLRESFFGGRFLDGISNAEENKQGIKKNLPMFNETGGLVVFLHIAKSGGTSIRNNFAEKSFENVKVRRIFSEQKLNNAIETVEWFLSVENKKTQAEGNEQVMLLELHGNHGEPMTIFDIHPYLQHWRRMAAANGKKVFAFTLLRDPVPFYVSYFNFFKRPDCQFKWCDRPLAPELTEEHLLKTMVPNHQCQYLARKMRKRKNALFPVTEAECDSVYHQMQADLDWIGTTEAMQETTLPLLTYMFSGNAHVGRTLTVHNKQSNERTLSVSALSSTGRQRIHESSLFDRELYTRTSSDYRLSMWQNFEQ
jgi:hypothetical protein